MKEIDELVCEFNRCNDELINAKENNSFHEAADVKAYMLGLAKGMTIVLNCNITTYNQEDSRKVDKCICILNILDCI